MQLSKEKLCEALEICAENHSTLLTINSIKKGNIVSDADSLIIHKCVPAVINKLKDADFMLGMCDRGMYVEYIK